MTSRIALVTGATQGLGRALVEGLARRLDADDIVLLTSRDAARVDAAAAEITSGPATVEGRRLDVSDPAAIDGLARELRDRFGGVDLVVSNATARTTPDRSPAEQVDDVVTVSNFATTRMLRAFLPMLRPGGRFLVVASTFGTLGHLDPQLRPLLDEASSLDDIDAVIESWRRAVHDGSAEQQGWPHWLNVPSKVAQVAAVRVVARQRREQDRRDGTLIASVCPGLFDTEASRPWFTDLSQAQTADEAAVALLDLLLAGTVDPAHYGELVRFGTALPWAAEIAPEGRAEARVTHIR